MSRKQRNFLKANAAQNRRQTISLQLENGSEGGANFFNGCPGRGTGERRGAQRGRRRPVAPRR